MSAILAQGRQECKGDIYRTSDQDRHVTIKQLAERLDSSSGNLSHKLQRDNFSEKELLEIAEALGLHLWGMEQDNEPIPPPTTLKDILLKQGDAAVKVEVFMPPIRERINNRFVKKTLSLPAWLAAAADRDKVNCSRVLQNALVEYLDAKAPPQRPQL